MGTATEGLLDEVQQSLKGLQNPNVMAWGVAWDELRHAPREKNRSALWGAVTSQCEAIVGLLLEAGADPSGAGEPLHAACALGFVEAVRLLLQYGAEIDLPDDYGRRPLHYAVEAATRPDTVEVVKLLLKAGADRDAADCYGSTPLRAISWQWECLTKRKLETIQMIKLFRNIPDVGWRLEARTFPFPTRKVVVRKRRRLSSVCKSLCSSCPKIDRLRSL